MSKLTLTRNDVALLFFFASGLALLFTGIFLNSLLAITGVAGLLIAWLLCIDTIIADHKMHLAKLIAFCSIILFLPLFLAACLGA